ncbi:LysR family transcriptional regulator [Bacillus sp. EAC]|uniref:LysR family transcriptional regulator n=1 Tax=Bacillus sp. EAC TaxID=1978338 RepID=UPI000B446EFB|nr:LysR family transcriptional regulator [Bacillus sp. EAC]
MHIQKLEFLVEVAKTGSISTAAENLHVSQSGISQAISKIEEELGIKLFERSRLGVNVTEDGSKIIKKAYEILMKYDEFLEEARSSLKIQSAELRVSTIPALITYLLKPLMEFKDIHPDSTIEIVENFSERTLEFIQQNKADIGLVVIYGEILEQIKDINVDVILEGKMKVYVSNNSPYAISKTITPEELVEQKVVLYNGDYLKWFVTNFQAAFGKLNILFSSNNVEELLRTTSNGFGIGFAPDFVMKNNPYVLNEKIVEVEILNYEQKNVALGLVRSKAKRPSKIEKHLIQFLKSELCYCLN